MTGALGNRNFRLLWGGQVVSQLGDAIGQIGAMFAVMELTHNSALALAGIVACEHVPALVVGLWSGVFVDRWNLRRTMLWADGARTLLCGLIALWLALGWLPGLYISMALMGCAAQFFNPSKASILPAMLEGEALAQGNALTSTADLLTTTLGYAVGGGIFAWAGRGLCFAADSMTFAVSFITIFRLGVVARRQVAKPLTAQSVLADFREGYAYISSRRVLVTVFGGLFLALLGFGVVNVLGPKFYTDALHVRKELFSLSGVLIGAGAACGMAVTAAANRKLGPRTVYWGGLAVLGTCLVAASTASNFGVLASLLVVLGVGNVLLNTGFQTVVQGATDEALRGRVFGLLSPTMTLATLLSAWVGGTLTGIVGIRPVFGAAGLLALAAAVWSAARLRGPGARLGVAEVAEVAEG